MPSLRRTAGFGDMEVIGDLDRGHCDRIVAGTPDWSELRNEWQAGSNQLFKGLTMKERTGQPLEGEYEAGKPFSLK